MEVGSEVPKNLNVFALFAGNLSSSCHFSYDQKSWAAARESPSGRIVDGIAARGRHRLAQLRVAAGMNLRHSAADYR
jgi:hypothetical protein